MPVPSTDHWAISTQALELAQRARAAGLPMVAYLLEIAALEACQDERHGDGDRRGGRSRIPPA
jgi:hypothetical protein